ncbi:hypothetical protein RB653_005766 [Dictyostelium firmibasis]|uniref:Uncharacterized protein n=1 Tax=Dictyostelium firmibasis TaxID=79012 RepID=A0AAN7U1T6_9MYCE
MIFKIKKIKNVHMYDVATILILVIVIIKLIKSEDSNIVLNNNYNSSNEPLNKTKDNRFEVNSTKISFLLNFLTSTSTSNKNVQKKYNSSNNNNNNNNNNSAYKNNKNYIMVGELNKITKPKPSDIQRDIIQNNTIEKTIDIKEKRLGGFKRRVLKIPLAFIQMIAISIALICLLIP